MSFNFTEEFLTYGNYEPEGIYLSAPFSGHHRLLQLWGENPSVYGQLRIGNVPLKGHNGIDFDLPKGTLLLAVDDGYVIEIGNAREGYGRFIVFQHRWGESLYAHLQEFTVESGQRIVRGEHIGYSGNTGTSIQPHLHFSIRIAPYDRCDGWGGYTNPLPFLEPTCILSSGSHLSI